MTSKRCTKCGLIKPLSDFHCQHRAKDGHAARCKACRRTVTYHAPPPVYALPADRLEAYRAEMGRVGMQRKRRKLMRHKSGA